MRHRAFSEDVLEYRSCETVLIGNRDLGLFGVAVGMPEDGGQQTWRQDGHGLSYRWRFPEGVEVRFRVEPAGDHLALTYSIVNLTESVLDRLHVHPCVITTEAPSFRGDAEKTIRDDEEYSDRDLRFAEMYSRLTLWSAGEQFTFASLPQSRTENHLSVMARGEPPINWAWWRNADVTFDEPFISLQSDRAKGTLALWFERASWASANVGDDRCCFHLFPTWSRLGAGECRTLRGALFWTTDDLDRVRRGVSTLSSQRP